MGGGKAETETKKAGFSQNSSWVHLHQNPWGIFTNNVESRITPVPTEWKFLKMGPRSLHF